MSFAFVLKEMEDDLLALSRVASNFLAPQSVSRLDRLARDLANATASAKAKPRARAGHPPFHVQFYGMVNDLPRLPCLVVHPVDVIALTILELHQKKWREHAESAKGRSELRLVPRRQRERFDRILTEWKALIARTDFPLAIVALQSAISPLAI